MTQAGGHFTIANYSMSLCIITFLEVWPYFTGAGCDVAGAFSGRAQAARLALIDGAAGLVWATRGKPRVVFAFTTKEGRSPPST